MMVSKVETGLRVAAVAGVPVETPAGRLPIGCSRWSWRFRLFASAADIALV